MGAVFTMLDSCGSTNMNTPSDYIEYELLRDHRITSTQKKKRIDIMGTAMHYAVDDFKQLIGMRDHNSDNEEQANDDEDYQNMSMLKRKYIKRKDSDQSMNS